MGVMVRRFGAEEDSVVRVDEAYMPDERSAVY